MNKVIFKFNLFALSFLISGSSVAKPTHVPNIVNSINTTFANELGLNVDDKIKQENFDEVAPTSQKLNQYPKKDFLSLQGGVNGGGGNQIGDQLYDLYEGSRHTISEQEILSKIDSRLKALDVLPRFVDLLKNLVTKRRWYFVDQPLINLPPSYTGIYQRTEQVAIQTTQTVLIDINLYKKMNPQSQLALFVHEILTTYYLDRTHGEAAEELSPANVRAAVRLIMAEPLPEPEDLSNQIDSLGFGKFYPEKDLVEFKKMFEQITSLPSWSKLTRICEIDSNNQVMVGISGEAIELDSQTFSNLFWVFSEIQIFGANYSGEVELPTAPVNYLDPKIRGWDKGGWTLPKKNNKSLTETDAYIYARMAGNTIYRLIRSAIDQNVIQVTPDYAGHPGYSNRSWDSITALNNRFSTWSVYRVAPALRAGVHLKIDKQALCESFNIGEFPSYIDPR